MSHAETDSAIKASLGSIKNGAEERNRTVDLFITNELLYQLSYFGILDHKSVNNS